MSIPKRWLGAFKAGHIHEVREFIDEELSYILLNKINDSNYTDKDSIAKLEYITQFNNEFHKDVIDRGKESALHNTSSLVKDCADRKNSVRRDISSIERKRLLSIDELSVSNGERSTEYLDAILNQRRNLDHETTVIEIIELKLQNDPGKLPL